MPTTAPQIAPAAPPATDEPPRIAVLLACYNRRATTLACLHHLLNEQDPPAPPPPTLEVYLVDDASPDDTGAAVQVAFPGVHVLQGTGSLFWCRGMNRAFAAARPHDYAYYLWLNDDTRLTSGALATLLGTARALQAAGHTPIVVGSTRDPATGILSYGGQRRRSAWHPFRYARVEPTDAPQPCDTFEGNCVLVSREAAQRVGNLDASFTHAMGDTDYGLRARAAGCGIWVAPGYLGTCPANPGAQQWRDASLPLAARLHHVRSPHGLPPRDYARFARRHGGPLWPLFWAFPYARLLTSIRPAAG